MRQSSIVYGGTSAFFSKMDKNGFFHKMEKTICFKNLGKTKVRLLVPILYIYAARSHLKLSLQVN